MCGIGCLFTTNLKNGMFFAKETHAWRQYLQVVLKICVLLCVLGCLLVTLVMQQCVKWG